MSNHRVMFIVEYEDGRTTEFSIDRWTLSLGDYAAKIIAYERQEKGPTSLVLIALIQKRFVLLRISDPFMGNNTFSALAALPKKSVFQGGRAAPDRLWCASCQGRGNRGGQEVNYDQAILRRGNLKGECNERNCRRQKSD